MSALSASRCFSRSVALAYSGPLGHLGRSERFAHPLPHLRSGGGDVDVAVGGLVDAGRRAGGMIVAGLLRNLTGHQPARGLEIEHEDLRLQQRGLDLLALAGFFALQQRRENAERCEQAGAQVRHRDSGPHRTLPRQAGDRHQPAHALGDLIEAGAIGVRPGLSESGDARIDELGIDLGERLVVDPEPAFHIWPIVLNHHVGLLHHPLEGRDTCRRLEIDRDAALVAVEIGKIRPVARPAHVGRLDVLGRLDLDHVRAPVGELAHACRPGAHAREVENGEARKSLGSAGGHRH